MKRALRALSSVFIAFLAALAPAASAQPTGTPIADALASVSDEVRVYNEHLTILASPWMEGRVPGSRGMDRAMEYVEDHFRRAGLVPAFGATEMDRGGTEVITANGSYRQPFPLGSESVVTRAEFSAAGTDFVAGKDFTVLGLGANGVVDGPMVFVGYSIAGGPGGYESFDGQDLSGKVALMLRFEPIDAEGKSRWGRDGSWSAHAVFSAKLGAIRDRNPAAVVIINMPGTNDPRAGLLLDASETGGKILDVPVLMMTGEAGAALIASAGPSGDSLASLRALADEGPAVVALGAAAHIAAAIEQTPLMAENIGGVLRGRGDLAGEYIVIGAHLDHLGMGDFGSMSGPGELHPGADDNASGSAGLLLMAEKLSRAYEALPADAAARSVLFLAFSGEESGLNGSAYYAAHPIVPIDDHAFMINFDMIGRIEGDRLSVSGMTTGQGLADWLAPYFEASPLSIVPSDSITGRSDHASFLAEGVPILFAMDAEFPPEYHTPRDVSALINRVDAVATIDLFAQIARGLATRPERFAFTGGSDDGPAAAAPSTPRSAISVRVGVRPSYDDAGGGVLVEAVTPESPASRAGLVPGDRMVRWGGSDIADIYGWMDMLGKNKPGDTVTVVVVRDGKESSFDLVLEGR